MVNEELLEKQLFQLRKKSGAKNTFRKSGAKNTFRKSGAKNTFRKSISKKYFFSIKSNDFCNTFLTKLKKVLFIKNQF